MSWTSAQLFTWLQGAGFYRDIHRQAVESLPPGRGQTWLDVGCGPGLVTRLAAGHGYSATGVDSDADMIRAARRIAARLGSPVSFQVGDLASIPAGAAEVVSAASLLAVLPDRAAGLSALRAAVRPGGSLLVIEPTASMTVENANRIIADGLPPKRRNALRMWAAARQGSTVDAGLFDALDAVETHFTPLLGGMVGAWRLRKSA